MNMHACGIVATHTIAFHRLMFDISKVQDGKLSLPSNKGLLF